MLLICLAAVVLVFTVIITPAQHGQLAHMLATVFLGVLLATLLAQFLMYTFFMRPADDIWQPSAFWDLMMQGMSRVFGTVVTLVVLLAFKDSVTTFLTMHNASLESLFPWMDSTWGKMAWAVLVLVLAVQIGRIIGSAWGTFALGLIMLDMLDIADGTRGVPPHIGRTVVEALIVLATWVNQSSPSADNALTMLGPARCTRQAIDAVWAVPTFPRYTTLRASRIQYALLGVSIALAWLCRFFWRDVL